jgi:hypothetical protein
MTKVVASAVRWLQKKHAIAIKVCLFTHSLTHSLTSLSSPCSHSSPHRSLAEQEMSNPNLNFSHSTCRLRRIKKVQFGVFSPECIVSAATSLTHSLTHLPTQSHNHTRTQSHTLHYPTLGAILLLPSLIHLLTHSLAHTHLHTCCPSSLYSLTHSLNVLLCTVYIYIFSLTTATRICDKSRHYQQ